jgi:tetratricopeptide (TPR) repeat protein
MSAPVWQLQAKLDQLERRGSDLLEVTACRHDLALALQDAGQLAEAERHLVAAYEGFARTLGTASALTVSSLLNLALVVRDRGRLTEAEQLLRRVVQARVAAFGPTHPLSLNARGNLVQVLADRGLTVQAQNGLRELLADYERIHGRDSDIAVAIRAQLRELTARSPRRRWWRRG